MQINSKYLSYWIERNGVFQVHGVAILDVRSRENEYFSVSFKSFMSNVVTSLIKSRKTTLGSVYNQRRAISPLPPLLA